MVEVTVHIPSLQAPFVVNLSNHKRALFDRLRANGDKVRILPESGS